MTGSGTLTGAWQPQTQNEVFASPNGSSGTPSFRALVAADIPSLPYGTGTVTSVAMTVPSFLSISGSPVTTAGTLAVSLQTQSANTLFAGPTTGAAATPTFRAMVVADMATGYPYANLSGAPTIPTITGTAPVLQRALEATQSLRPRQQMWSLSFGNADRVRNFYEMTAH